MELHTLAPNTCIIRDTASRRGRTQAIAPGTTPASRHLHYGRIILHPGDRPIRIETRACETGFVGLKGSATATVDAASYTIDRYDALRAARPPDDRARRVGMRSRRDRGAGLEASSGSARPLRGRAGQPGLHFNAGGPCRSAT
jgi:hypothetical protein